MSKIIPKAEKNNIILFLFTLLLTPFLMLHDICKILLGKQEDFFIKKYQLRYWRLKAIASLPLLYLLTAINRLDIAYKYGFDIRVDKRIDVPTFKEYFPSLEQMNVQQRDFYIFWKWQITNGNPLGVNGNVSYLFCYAYEVLSLNNFKEIICKLSGLANIFKEEKKFSEYCKIWIADCYVKLKNFKKAVEIFPKIDLHSRASAMTDKLLSIKLVAGIPISGRDIITLFGAKITAFVIDHLSLVASHIENIIQNKQKKVNQHLLNLWKIDTYKCPFTVFGGSIFSEEIDTLYHYSFSLNNKVEKFAKQITREAENIIREQNGIPKVGEGWVSETKLFYQIKNVFPSLTIIQHFQPDWLGRQHLDIYIKEMQIALEYQGLQHEKPIDFFGGQDAFENTKKRDRRKKSLCKKHGVELIYIYENYNLDKLIEELMRNKQLVI